MHHRRHRGYCQLSPTRTFFLIVLGICLGFGLTVGAVFAMKEYAPDMWAKTLVRFAMSQNTDEPNKSGSIDLGLAQKAIVELLNSSQGRDMLYSFFDEALESPEFRNALLESLEAFFKSPEGIDLIRRIAYEVIKP